MEETKNLSGTEASRPPCANSIDAREGDPDTIDR